HAAVLEVPGDDDQQRDCGNGQADVDEKVHDVVDDPTRVCGGDTEDRGQRGGEHGGCRTEQKGAPSADHDLGEDVAALVGGAEEMVPRRRLPRGEQVEVVRMGDG